jgi:hypothetical protein
MFNSLDVLASQLNRGVGLDGPHLLQWEFGSKFFVQ